MIFAAFTKFTFWNTWLECSSFRLSILMFPKNGGYLSGDNELAWHMWCDLKIIMHNVLSTFTFVVDVDTGIDRGNAREYLCCKRPYKQPAFLTYLKQILSGTIKGRGSGGYLAKTLSSLSVQGLYTSRFSLGCWAGILTWTHAHRSERREKKAIAYIRGCYCPLDRRSARLPPKTLDRVTYASYYSYSLLPMKDDTHSIERNKNGYSLYS